MIVDMVPQNPNSIFPCIKRELNPAAPPNPTTSDLAKETEDHASTTSRRSYLHSLQSFIRANPSPTHVHAQAEPELLQQQHHPPRPSISGPSLYTFERRSPEWSITESDVYRNSSPIRHPLIEHPDLEKGFQRPKEWGKRTPDLIEAKAISAQMRRIDRLRAERNGKLPELDEGEEGVTGGRVGG